MKILLKDIIIVALILMTLWIGIHIIHNRTNAALLNGDTFKIDRSINILIAGDSHTMTAIDPALFPGSINLSQAGENYFFTYYKLKTVFEKNRHIKTVILGVSYANLTKNIENSFYDETLNERYLDIYYWLLDKQGKKLVLRKHNVRDYLKYEWAMPFQLYNNNLKMRVELLKDKPDLNEIRKNFGGYYKGMASKVTEKKINDYIKETFYGDSGKYIGNSNIAHKYLMKILDLCQNNNVRVIAISTPLHPELIKRIPPAAKEYYIYTLANAFCNKNEITYYDYSEMPFDDSCFGDANHLDGKGAAIFTSYILKIL